MKNYMKYYLIAILLFSFALLPFQVSAQNEGVIIQGTVVSTTDNDVLIGVNISEIDANNRVVNGTITDVNGHYVIRMKNTANKLSFTYLGFEKAERRAGTQKTVNVSMKELSKVINEVVITATKKTSQGGYVIPQREIGAAMQSIDTKEFEGLQVTSIDDALQGRIAGLDIVANSSDPGSPTSMRIRGVSSITGNSEPLIVLNGIPYSIDLDPNFDYANSNQEQYANMLSINPEDIAEITVLKDAAASAIWGSKGANGVIMITTKKGAAGKTRLDYTYRFTRKEQPQGRKMLTGDDYTMYIKEAYLNPRQNDEANNLDEYNYDKNFPDYENYNNNTDWVKEVSQIGYIHDHYLTLSGGGERATYRFSGGFLTDKGTVIGQEMNRISSRLKLDYRISDRILVVSEIAFTNTDNRRNYEGLLDVAYRKMPNVSVYVQDRFGNNTGEFYNIPRSSRINTDQRDLKNPVAVAALATNRLESTRIQPTLGLIYDLLDPNKHVLRLSLNASFDNNNDKTRMFLPMSVSNLPWDDENANRSEDASSDRLNVFSDNNLLFIPSFENKNHSMTLYGSMQVTTGNSSSQKIVAYALPSEDSPDPSGSGYLKEGNSSNSSWRGLAFMGRGHYAYKGRYIIDGTLRFEGSTRFGPDNRWGTFPGISLKWIVSDEAFMAPAKKWLSMFAVRPSWGISGNQPGSEYLHFSRYVLNGTYMDMTAIRPSNLRLNNLKWETATQYNYGVELGFLDDTYTVDFNYYTKRTEDMLFKDINISSISGYDKLPYINGGVMDNKGWEIYLRMNNFIKTKDFSVGFTLNFSDNKNTIVNLNQSLLEGYNTEYDFKNGTYLTRIQENNSFGSIYGFRYKGTYKYDKYEKAMAEEGRFMDENGKPLAPFAADATGHVIMDENGKPKPMFFAYNRDVRHVFRGGDAIYEDINHDGSIDQLDIVYLGNSNPILNGGFGPNFRYKNFAVRAFFNFRYGNKVVNSARMHAENMYTDNNQSIAVNWRWRQDGDETDMPRALYRYGYNWLGSDRYVEDGSFLRFKYLTFDYAFPSKVLKPYGLSKLSFYLTINNLFVWTNYTGVDPEVGYGTLGNNKGISFDNSSTPRTKDFTLGVSVGF